MKYLYKNICFIDIILIPTIKDYIVLFLFYLFNRCIILYIIIYRIVSSTQDLYVLDQYDRKFIARIMTGLLTKKCLDVPPFERITYNL